MIGFSVSTMCTNFKTAHVQIINQKWSDVFKFVIYETKMASTRGGRSSQSRRTKKQLWPQEDFLNSGSGRKQEREKSRRRIRLEINIYKSWFQAKLEATYSSTRNSGFAMNLLSLENRRRQDKRQKSNYKQIRFIRIINLPWSCTACLFCHINNCIHSALYRPPLTKTTTITRTFPPGAARPFAFTAFRLTFLDGKTFDFAISD